MSSKPLSEREQNLFDLLLEREEKDVPIRRMFERFTASSGNLYTRRRMQQRLGAVIARINAKLDAQRIIPGQLKGTYRLTSKVNASE